MSKAPSIKSSLTTDKMYEDCRLRHAALVRTITKRDREVMGLPEPAPRKTRRGKVIPKGPTGSVLNPE
jgi:hypothetical protein